MLELQDPDSALSIHGTVRVDPSHPQDGLHQVTATLKDFTVHLFDRDPDAATALVSIKFDQLKFTSETGHKPDPDCKLADEDAVKFHGALEFVDRLRELIPANGFSDPPDVDVTKTGLSSTFSSASRTRFFCSFRRALSDSETPRAASDRAAVCSAR